MQQSRRERAGDQVQFVFPGKSENLWKVRMRERHVARTIKALQDLPGQYLFQYLDEEGAPQTIDSSDVNQCLRDISGSEMSAKDFRTWAGTVPAGAKFAELPAPPRPAAAKRAIKEVILDVSERLGKSGALVRAPGRAGQTFTRREQGFGPAFQPPGPFFQSSHAALTEQCRI
jgi:DNA topoisomerase-1